VGGFWFVRWQFRSQSSVSGLRRNSHPSQRGGGARRMQQNDRRDVCDGFHGRNNHQGTPVVERVETACWTLRDQLIPA